MIKPGTPYVVDRVTEGYAVLETTDGPVHIALDEINLEGLCDGAVIFLSDSKWERDPAAEATRRAAAKARLAALRKNKR
jgi:hypothetical protein